MRRKSELYMNMENLKQYAVGCILHGDAKDPQRALEELCGKEKISSPAMRRIGFAA